MANKKSTSPNKQSRSTQKRATQQKNSLLVLGGAVLLVVLVVAGAIYIGNQQNSPATEALPAEISVEQAYQKYQDGAFVLDVRTPEEWDVYHAPGTTLIPLDELGARLSEIPQDEEIVVVCRSGNRSQQGRDILQNAGYEQVTSMSGGLNAWKAAGYPLEGQNP